VQHSEISIRKSKYRNLKAYGLEPIAQPNDLEPCIVSCGLSDILLPVSSREILYKAVQKREEVVKISKVLQVVGVHMYCCEPFSNVTAYCRNFAPLFGIDEEAATGTSNGSLTYYLYKSGVIKENSVNTFLQGKSTPASVILGRIANDRVFIGGTAVVSVSGSIRV
jgi:PhzF family phenazine biosynthesis protein